jgi:hypothetical protein
MSLLLYRDINLCSDSVCGVMLCIELFTINLFNYVLVYLFIFTLIIAQLHKVNADLVKKKGVVRTLNT